MTNLELAKKYEDYILGMRRYFHENPEVSDHEDNTIARISEELTGMGIEHTIIEHGGILATIKGPKDNGKVVLLRADCDALPVQETDDNLLEGKRTCKSKIDGAMHACGHDGHMSMLLGAAKMLLEKKDELEGTVLLSFERGEEITGNVRFIFNYIEKNNIKVDAVYGTHVWSDLPAGTLAINDTDMMAGVMPFDITIEGRGGHGSRPDQSNSPVDCFVAIYNRLQAIRLTKVNPFKTCAYSIGLLEGGKQQNVIPQTVRFGGTMRTFDPDGAGLEFHDAFKEAIEGICAAYQCKPIFNSWRKPTRPVVNDPKYAQFARKVISAELGEEVIQCEPWMASESFGRYISQWHGVFAFLGINNPEKGTGAAHHNQKFDIDEDVLKKGAAAAVTYAIEYLRADDMPAEGRRLTYRDLLRADEDAANLKLFYGEEL